MKGFFAVLNLQFQTAIFNVTLPVQTFLKYKKTHVQPTR